jgi:predicted NUDIX family NTP pyrophosphohydrolase
MYEFLLVHPGGPFWAKKDEHAWSIPKGEIDAFALQSPKHWREGDELRRPEEEIEKEPDAGAPAIYSRRDIQKEAKEGPNTGAPETYSRRDIEEIEETEEMEEMEEGRNVEAPVISSRRDIEATARREFAEETGQQFLGHLIPLPPVKTSGRKVIHAYLGAGDFDPAALKSNLFEMEWPPRSGNTQSFPEVDRAAWFYAETSKTKIHKGQVPIIEFALEFLFK